MGSTEYVAESKGYVNQLCDDTETSYDDCLDTLETLPKHTGCYAHTLQLLVRDGLNECGGHLNQTISKASSIVSYVQIYFRIKSVYRQLIRLALTVAGRNGYC